MAKENDLVTLWRKIQQAGGIPAYINAQLAERGLLVQRRNASRMSTHELSEYKKQLKAEAAERKRLRKETWQAYKATHIVHLGDGVYWDDRQQPDRWDIPNAEERAAENELPAIDNADQLAETLGLTIAELRWLTYHRDAARSIHYRRFTIPKRDGSERAIWAPAPKLKAAQHWILRNIVERLLVHGSTHGFLAGRSILSNAQVHTNSRVVVKMDIRGFFPTVTMSRVKGIFRKAGYREPVALLLALLCTEAPREIVPLNGHDYFVSLGPRCLPQGAPTSPALTNTLCQRLDRRNQGLAKKLGWRYTRYADDLTFSLPMNHKEKPRLATLLGTVRSIVEDEGFQIHPEKTRILRKGSRQKVTGLIVNGRGSPRVPRKLRRQLRAAIHNLQQGKTLHDGESIETLRGYAAFLFMSNPQEGAKLLEALALQESKSAD